MRRLSRLVVPLILLSVIASLAPLGAQPLDRSGAGALTGTLVSADTVAVVVRTDEGSLVTFSVENPASVPAGLLPGTRVTVRYDVGEKGRYRVVRVGVASFPPEPGSTTSVPAPPAESTAAPSAPAPGPPTTATLQRSPPVARGASGASRPPSALPAVRPVHRTAPAAVPEPTIAVGAPPAAAARPADLPPVRTPPSAGDLLVFWGSLIVAAGLLALAYALVRPST